MEIIHTGNSQSRKRMQHFLSTSWVELLLHGATVEEAPDELPGVVQAALLDRVDHVAVGVVVVGIDLVHKQLIIGNPPQQ
jgi:hypothetical protein